LQGAQVLEPGSAKEFTALPKSLAAPTLLLRRSDDRLLSTSGIGASMQHPCADLTSLHHHPRYRALDALRTYLVSQS